MEHSHTHTHQITRNTNLIGNVRFDTVSLVQISSNYSFAVTVKSIRGFQFAE